MKKYLKDMEAEEIIKLLKQGETVIDGETEVKYKIVNDIICSFINDKLYFYNTHIVFTDEDLYFDFPDKPELEVGKFYRTRSRDKVFLCKRYPDDGSFSGIVLDEDYMLTWDSTGICFSERDHDIIEERKDA